MPDSRSISILFARGARRVTGSNFLIEAKDGGKTTRVLIDCGLAQGERYCESVNKERFSYDPASVDAIFFTHAHADHIGLFPKLVKEGFSGRAYATPPTAALMPVMLEDSLKIVADEARRCRDEAPYAAEDIKHAVALVQPTGYHEKIEIASGISATLYNAGHIIGSASVLLDIFGTKLCFTGDLGRVPPVIVPEREVPEGIDYLFMESVYGNRVHAAFEESEGALIQAVKDTIARRGTLLIPAFSLERTQIILETLERGVREGDIPAVPTFMDSPLAAKVTAIYREFPDYLNAETKGLIEKGEDPFSFSSLHVTARESDAHLIEDTVPPKVIIAGAGMSHGGRIRTHEKRYLPEKETTLLLVGYQVPGSLGRRLQDGAKEVNMDGAKVSVRATVKALDGFSAHADRNDLMSYVEAAKPKKVFVILGETESATYIAQRISGFLGLPVDVPREGEQVQLIPA